MSGLIASGQGAEAKPPSDLGVVVRTQTVKVVHQQATVGAQGLVIAADEVALQPEVQGRVVFRSDKLVPGGRFKKGEVLLRIDASEYALRAKKSSSQLEQAQQQLTLEESRGEIAKEEWRLIGKDGGASESGRAVALREPQKKEAEARIDLAKQERGLAVLNVGRTVLRAPFNGFVRTGNVNVGQYISPAVSLGTLVGSDEFWVQVSVPVESLRDLRVPGLNVEVGEGSKLVLWQELGDERIERSGEIVRLFGDVDPVGRMARVLAKIVDPLGLELEASERGLPLLLGSYVHVDMEAREMADVIEIPRAAVHAGKFVYVYGKDDRLQVRTVNIAWRKPKSFLISGGLSDGEEIITSRVGNVVEGLKIRRVQSGAAGGDLKKAEAAPSDVAQKTAQTQGARAPDVEPSPTEAQP